MRSLVCAFVVRMQLSLVCSQHAPPVMSKCIYCYKCVSDKKVKLKKIMYVYMGELRLSGSHTVTEYEMSGKPYGQKSGLKNHTYERIFQVMTRFDQVHVMAPSVNITT